MKFPWLLCALASAMPLLHAAPIIVAFDEFNTGGIDFLNVIATQDGKMIANMQVCENLAQNANCVNIGGPPLNFTLDLPAGTIANNSQGITYLTEPGDPTTLSDALQVFLFAGDAKGSSINFLFTSDFKLPAVLKNCVPASSVAETGNAQTPVFALVTADGSACVANQTLALPANVQVTIESDVPKAGAPEPSALILTGAFLATIVLARRKAPRRTARVIPVPPLT